MTNNKKKIILKAQIQNLNHLLKVFLATKSHKLKDTQRIKQ